MAVCYVIASMIFFDHTHLNRPFVSLVLTSLHFRKRGICLCSLINQHKYNLSKSKNAKTIYIGFSCSGQLNSTLSSLIKTIERNDFESGILDHPDGGQNQQLSC